MIDILKAVFLFLGVWMTILNTGLFFRGQSVRVLNLIFHAVGITGFVYLQWLM